jgi:hypothetical protein
MKFWSRFDFRFEKVFIIAPAILKARIKSGQKWLENNHIATFIKVEFKYPKHKIGNGRCLRWICPAVFAEKNTMFAFAILA